jgi:hypothetical protein
LSSTLPRICVLFFLRRTHSALLPLSVPWHFVPALLPQVAGFSQHLRGCSTVCYLSNGTN